jgi:drug/metabolite transporter (DMT)-like permease
MTPTIKAGYRTTEFWVTVLTALVGLAIALGYVDPAQAHGAGLAAAVQVVAGILGMVVPAATYAISRGLAKASPAPTVTITAPTPPAQVGAAARASVAPGPTA